MTVARTGPGAFRAPAYDAQAALNLLAEGLPGYAEAVLGMAGVSPVLRPALAAMRAGAIDEARAMLQDVLAKGVEA